MHMALGDHQVANVAAEVEARTIGARLRTPAVDPGRNFDKVPYYGIRPIRWFPFDGSAFVVWDAGPTRTDARQRDRQPARADHEHAAARRQGPALARRAAT